MEIWTIMSGCPDTPEVSPFAQVLHQVWGMSSAEQVVQVRRAEDRKAAELVGAMPVHIEFLDCIYRRGRNGGWLYTDVFVPPHADEVELPQKIPGVISAGLRPEDQLVCELGVGAHIDHFIVRSAVEELKRPVYYLADIPYLFKHKAEHEFRTEGLVISHWPVSETGLEIWKEAIGAYTSQGQTLKDLIGGEAELDQHIERYWSVNKRTLQIWSAV